MHFTERRLYGSEANTDLYFITNRRKSRKLVLRSVFNRYKGNLRHAWDTQRIYIKALESKYTDDTDQHSPLRTTNN